MSSTNVRHRRSLRSAIPQRERAQAARRVSFAIAALLIGGCASSYYVNERTGERIPAHGPVENADLAACQAIYQRAFAQGPQLWYGEIVPDCMKARGWRLE